MQHRSWLNCFRYSGVILCVTLIGALTYFSWPEYRDDGLLREIEHAADVEILSRHGCVVAPKLDFNFVEKSLDFPPNDTRIRLLALRLAPTPHREPNGDLFYSNLDFNSRIVSASFDMKTGRGRMLLKPNRFERFVTRLKRVFKG